MSQSHKQSQFECCTKKQWYKLWSKLNNTCIGFDLWCTAHGLRDCLLIDHSLWRQPKLHYKIIQLIRQFAKTHSCAKTLHYFYFDEQLFITNNTKFKQRLLNDCKNRFIHYLFVNVSPNIEKPTICNEKQSLFIHSALKQIGCIILDTKENKSKCKINHNDNDKDSCRAQSFTFKSKRKRKKNKSNNRYNKNNINSLDISYRSGIKQYLYPTICGYLLNYAFIYFTNDMYLNCLNQHKLVLLKFKLDNKDMIQFSVPDIIMNSMDDQTLSIYCNKRYNNNVTMFTEILNQAVSL